MTEIKSNQPLDDSKWSAFFLTSGKDLECLGTNFETKESAQAALEIFLDIGINDIECHKATWVGDSNSRILLLNLIGGFVASNSITKDTPPQEKVTEFISKFEPNFSKE